MRVETLVLRTSQWSKYAHYGARFADLYSATLRDAGLLCLAIYRKVEDCDDDSEDEEEANKVNKPSKHFNFVFNNNKENVQIVVSKV